MFTPQLKIRILNVLKDAENTLTAKEIASKLELDVHSIGQQLYAYRFQGLVKSIKDPKVNALRYELTQKGLGRMEFFKNQNNNFMTKS